jgi:hypothetical protein
MALVLLLPLALIASFLRPSAVVLAVTPESANVQIADVTTSFAFPCTPCPVILSGSSSGNITGEDSGGTPYEVAWPVGASTANLAGGMNVSALCGGLDVMVTGGSVSGGTVTISGADLYYGGLHTGATVTLKFTGLYEGDLFIPAIYEVDVSGGPLLISFVPVESAGAVEMTPTPPIAGCVGTQGFVLSGTMLTAA